MFIYFIKMKNGFEIQNNNKNISKQLKKLKLQVYI